MSMEIGPKLKQLHNFLTDSNSEESKNYIADLLSGETDRPEELFVNNFLSRDFWKEIGYSIDEIKHERHAGITGRVEITLIIEDKKIAVECKRPYLVKKGKEIKNELDGNDISELKDQIGNYLHTHDFIIFTNGFYWYFYSRESYRAWLQNKDKKGNNLKPYFKLLTSDTLFEKQSSDFILNILSRQNILDTLLGLEIKSIRHILTDEFFVDLKSWVKYADEALANVSSESKEKTTILINKLIFVRTMESFGIIPNGYLSSLWNRKKGIRKSTVKFIDDVDDELSDIYDTELFSSQYIENEDGEVVKKNGVPQFNPDRAKNLSYSSLPEEFFTALLKETDQINLKDTGITKLSLNNKEFYIKSIYWWRFESISADILGKAYETYLAKERKKLGIFYTTHQLTEYISEKCIGTKFNEKILELKKELDNEKWNREKIESVAKTLADIRICDPSCGSGSFLIQSVRVIWKKYLELERLIRIKEKENTTGGLDDYSTDKFALIRYLAIMFKIEDRQQRMSHLILRHIHGNDKDINAVDTAKLNIWLECLRLDPNSFRLDSVKGKRHVLPNLELNITHGDSLIGVDEETAHGYIASMTDSIQSIFKMREDYLKFPDRTYLAKTASMLRDGIQGFPNSEIINEMGIKSTEDILKITTPTHWSLKHSTAFYDKNGNLKSKNERGFDIIVGNPPWEVLKPNIDEFCSPIYEKKGLDKFSQLEPKEKQKYLQEILKDPSIKSSWEKYSHEISLLANYFNNSKLYQYQRSKTKSKRGFGELNLYRLFVERCYTLLKKDGICGLVIPSNLCFLDNTKGLRELLFGQNRILSIFGFDNVKGIFEDLHRQWKFMTFVFQKSEKAKSFKAAFSLKNAEVLDQLEKQSFDYDMSLIEKTSPDTMSLVECSNQLDENIMVKVFEFPLLINDGKWHLDFPQGDFNTTTHKDLFNTQQKGAILYDGKMIHQFTNSLRGPQFWVEWEPAIKKLKSTEEKKVKAIIKKAQGKSKSNIELPNIQLGCDFYRLSWRHVSRSTDWRTMICTILPPKTFQSDGLYFIKPVYFDGKSYKKSISTKEMMYLCGLFNSFVVDFVLRHRVDMNVSSFFIHELPIPRLNESNHYFSEMVKRVGSLVCIGSEYDSLKKELNIEKSITDPDTRQEIISKINAYAAKIYNINQEELEYILEKFSPSFDNLKKQIIQDYINL